jgi:hypothetical protein
MSEINPILSFLRVSRSDKRNPAIEPGFLLWGFYIADVGVAGVNAHALECLSSLAAPSLILHWNGESLHDYLPLIICIEVIGLMDKSFSLTVLCVTDFEIAKVRHRFSPR